MKKKFQSIQWIGCNSIYQQRLEATRKPEIGHYNVSEHADQIRTELLYCVKEFDDSPDGLPCLIVCG